MPPRLPVLKVVIGMALGSFGGVVPIVAPAASTYHVSPRGDDQQDGKSPAAAWRTLKRVNSARLKPGDEVRFERGGEWRESLVAGSSGQPGQPILYATYGTGPKPKFWGSELIHPEEFEPTAGGVYQVKVGATVHSVLLDHTFLRSTRLITGSAEPLANLDHVRSHPGSWWFDQGVLHINTGRDPRFDPRVVSVVVRDDIVASNGQDHLIFRDLEVDESARFDAGYGFRIMGSAVIRLEGCAAYRAGKHHFGVINSTGFVGVDLMAAEAMPDQGAGGASAFVSYSDASRRGDSSSYQHCTADRLGDPATGGHYPAFVTHGAGIGSIVLEDLTTRGGAIALGNGESGASVLVLGGRLEDATLTLDGRGMVIDGLTIVGKQAGVTLNGVENRLQNLLITGGNFGFAGYQAAITEGGKRNQIRSCTVVLDPAAPDFNAALSLKRRDSQLHWSGNVLITNGTVVRTWFAGFEPRQFTADSNFYSPNARFDTRWAGAGALSTLEAWKKLGLDPSSTAGDPGFTNPAHGDYTPRAGSPLIDSAVVDPLDANPVRTDHARRSRPQGKAPDRGAFEAPERSGPTRP